MQAGLLRVAAGEASCHLGESANRKRVVTERIIANALIE
jgi:hypothetical protein